MKKSRYAPIMGGILKQVEPLSFLVSPELSERQVKIAESRQKKVHAWKITYRSNGHLVNGFAVAPRKSAGPLPCIIWNRGGSRDFGALTEWQVFAFLGRVATWGYVVVASQYSGNGGSEGVDEFGASDVMDVLSLKKVLRQIPGADTERIGMVGGSRGGLMTYLCMARVKWIRAAVTVAGAADLTRQAKQRPEMNKKFIEMFGGSVKAMRARSAVYWAEKFCKNTPLLMMHGTNDWRVDPQESLDLSSALLRAGRHHKLVMFEGDDHGLHGHWEERWNLTKDWLDRFVRDGEKIIPVVGK